MATKKQISVNIDLIDKLPAELDKSIQVFRINLDKAKKWLDVIKKFIPALPITISIEKQFYFDIKAIVYGFKINTYIVLKIKEDDNG